MTTTPDTTIALMREAARALRSPVSSLGEEIRALDTLEKAVAVAKAERLAEMEESKAHKADGAASITTWARRELHQDAHVTTSQVKAAATMRELPEVADLARAGELGLRHLQSFTYALAHVEQDKLREQLPAMVKAAWRPRRATSTNASAGCATGWTPMPWTGRT